MAPRHTIEHRVTKLETHLAEVETCHGESIYKMRRQLTKHDILWRKLFQRFDILFQHLGIEAVDGIGEVSDEEVDDALDQE